MEFMFMGLFILAEIVLTVLTFIRFKEKSDWLKNRMLVRIIETVLLTAIVLMPFTYMKWRFLAAMAVLIIRLLIAGIVWLAKRKKVTGIKRKPGTVISCFISVVIVSISMTPAFIFTNYHGLETTGKYTVSQTSAILVDKDRIDSFENDGSFREVPVHFYYPQTEGGNFPLVVFSHGAFGYHESNYSTYAELASNGYVVAALDHPHHAIFTKDTDGKTVIVDSKFMNDAMGINSIEDEEMIFSVTQSWMKLRTDDENFVLDTIKDAKDTAKLSDAWHTDNANTVLSVISKTDAEKIGLLGHSLGGASSTAVARQRSDIDAVVVLDGTMLGERTEIKDGKHVYISEAYPVPVLDFTKESDYNEREQYKDENGYAYVNEYVIKNAVDGKTVVFQNAGHMDFTDLPLISPSIASMLGHGDVNSEEMMNTVNAIVLNWFDYYLKDEGTLDIQARY